MIVRTPAFLFSAALCILLAFSSCNGFARKDGDTKPKPEDAQLVNINGDYSMMIPKHMKSTNELNVDASLQYQNIYKGLFIIVIDEPKDEFIETFKDYEEYDEKKSAERNYREVQMKMITEKLTIRTTPQVKKATIDGLEAEVVDFTANAAGPMDDIYYKTAFIDGKNNMYMVMTWTLEESKEKNNEEMDAMLNSFKLQQAGAAK